MRKIYFVLTFIFPALSLTAQVYNNPESVEKYPVDGSYFVSNSNAGDIVKLLPNGTLQSFATGFTGGPHGLELVGDTLYACDGNYIRLVNPVTGAIINSINLGATFLNGITHAGHMLYVTDFSAKKIYRFNAKTNAFNVFVPSLTKSPNGIIYDYVNDRLVFVTWGSSAPVYELDLYDSTVTLLTTTTTGNCDGIAMNCQGEFFVASWSPNAINKYNSNFTSSTSVSIAGLNYPADIYFDHLSDTLTIPNSNADNVIKSFQASCLVGVEEEMNQTGFEIFPNPAAAEITLRIQEPCRIKLMDAQGNIVYNSFANAQQVSISLENYTPGIYFVQLQSGNRVQTVKLSKI